jgi:dipeptidyl aminopeptidase/acylaminoacyl peptidase
MRRLRLCLIGFVLTAGLAATAAASEHAAAPGSSPHGAILFTGGPAGRTVYAVDARGGRLKELVAGPVDAAHWSPDGRRLAFLRPVDDLVATNRWGLYVKGARGASVRRLTTIEAYSMPSFAWSPDGRRIAYEVKSAKSSIFVIGVDGRGKVELTDGGGPVWSPDGRRIAFVRGNTRTYNSELYVVGSDGTGVRRLTTGLSVFSTPSWSADGTRLAFYPCCLKGFAIVELSTARLRTFGKGVLIPSWSPNGKWIALGGPDVSVIRPDFTGLRRVSSIGTGVGPRSWSPDSRTVAVTDPGPDFVSDILVVPIDGRAPRRVTAGWRHGYGNYGFEWHPTSASVAKLDGRYVPWATPSDSIAERRLLRTTRVVERLAADGARVAIAYSGSTQFSAAPVELWAPGGAVTRFRPTGSGARGLGLAGERAAWSYLSTAQSRDGWTLQTATASIPRAVAVVRPGPDPFFITVTDLVGDGALLVFTRWGPCRLSQSDPCASESKRNGRLFRLEGEHVVEIASSTGALTPLSVDAGRILVDHEDGTLEILDSDGRSFRSFQLNASLVRGARLQGRDLVVLTPDAVEVTDAQTGAFLRRWPSPSPDARLMDVQDGIAVLVVAAKVHLLNVWTGVAREIEAPGPGPVNAQLEPSGLFYSYRVDDAKYPGRVAFVPFDDLPLR